MNTLEEFGAQLATELGRDPANPAVQAKIVADAADIRSKMPGVDDATIIAQQGETIKAQASTRYPKPVVSVQPSASASAYRTGTEQFQKDFSAENEQAVRGKVNLANAFEDAGRSLGLAGRLGANASQNAVLDAQSAATRASNAAPLQDWQARKAVAVQALEQQVKAGQVEADDVRNQLTKMGLEQALAERADKAAQAAAENDPTSISSEGMRKLATEYAQSASPEMIPQLAKMSATQMKTYLPWLEKKYAKVIEDAQKTAALADKAQARADAERVRREDQAFRAGESAKDRASRLQAAQVKAAGSGAGGGPIAPAEPGKISGLKKDKQGNISLSPDLQKALGPLAASYEQAARGLTEIENIIPQIDKASASGIGSAVSGAQRYLGIETDRRKADEALTRFATAMLPTMDSPLMKGAPSEGDARRALATINDPQSTSSQKTLAVNALKTALNESVSRYTSSMDQFDAPTKQRLAAAGIQAPPSATSKMKDKSGRVFNIPRDKVKEAIADGLLPSE